VLNNVKKYIIEKNSRSKIKATTAKANPEQFTCDQVFSTAYDTSQFWKHESGKTMWYTNVRVVVECANHRMVFHLLLRSLLRQNVRRRHMLRQHSLHV